MIDSNELRRLAQEATPGPWKMLPVGDGRQKFAVADSEFLSILTVTDEGDATFGTVYDDDDARFIAAANPATMSELLDRLEAAEKDIALKERVIDTLGSELNAVAKERDELRAKVAEMEKQEPVAFALYSGWARKAVYLSEIEACEQRDRRQLTADLGGSLEAYRVVPLYALPGAKGE